MQDHFLISEKKGKNYSFGCICKKKDMVNKNTFMNLECVAYNQDELLIKNSGF